MRTFWMKSSFSQYGNCVELGWHKSSFSFNGDCVEINHQSVVKVRNSNHPDRCVLEFDPQAVSLRIEGIKDNEFDNFI